MFAARSSAPPPDAARAMSTTIRILEGVGQFLFCVAIMTDGLKGLAGSSVRTVRSKPAATPLCESVPLCSGVEFEEAIGRLRGGRTSKIHTLADDRDRPVGFALTQRKPADVVMAIPLLGAVAKPERLPASKVYDADSSRWLKQRKIRAATPSTASRRIRYPLDRTAISAETSSNGCSAGRRTGGASQPETAASLETISPGLALAVPITSWT